MQTEIRKIKDSKLRQIHRDQTLGDFHWAICNAWNKNDNFVVLKLRRIIEWMIDHPKSMPTQAELDFLSSYMGEKTVLFKTMKGIYGDDI